MIIYLKDDADPAHIDELIQTHGATLVDLDSEHVAILSAKVRELEDRFEPLAKQIFVLESDLQLASRAYRPASRAVRIGDFEIGGTTGNTLFMAGPCAVESQEQIDGVADLLVKLGIRVLRAGCFKPRTSPYSFQGLGAEGLRILARARERTGLRIITEVRDASHVDAVIETADIVQIGAKAMYDHGILRACGNARKPVLLKRGFGSNLQEFAQAAEFIMSSGNPDVILCERGIRTFETKTRFTLDLCGVAYLKEHVNLPIVVDTSHAMGYRYGVPDLTRAAVAMGIDGLLIESHPDPDRAKSDASQQLNFAGLTELHESLGPVAAAVGRQLV